MSRAQASCPGCGAPIGFRFSQAVQTTCEYCKAIVVRHDVNLERVGQAADVPMDGSPIQIGTEGQYRNKNFIVLGRIVYEYEAGRWNEWHLVFSDGTSGWLSDALLEYAVSFLVQTRAPLPPAQKLNPMTPVQFPDVSPETYLAGVRTNANYVTVQGELPFEYWDKTKCFFVDLRTFGRGFGTLDYTENPPLLFLGETVEFEELKLRNTRIFEGWS